MTDSLLTEVPKNWLRGVLEPCLLAFLRNDERYGYELGVLLSESGLGTVPGGSLYPALLRLEKNGLIVAEWKAGDGGPGRKYYQLSEKGREQLDSYAEQWTHFNAAVTTVIESSQR